jgi:hypothetical protein
VNAFPLKGKMKNLGRLALKFKCIFDDLLRSSTNKEETNRHLKEIVQKLERGASFYSETA